MQTISKLSHAAVATVAALTFGAGVSFAAPGDRGDNGNRGDRGDRGVRVEKSEAPREMRRGDRGTSVEKTEAPREGAREMRRGDRDVNVVVRGDRRRGDGNWRGGGRRDRIVRGQRYNWGPGFAFYFSDGYYYGECGWLKRRARQTGNPIWWRRFQQCRNFS